VTNCKNHFHDFNAGIALNSTTLTGFPEFGSQYKNVTLIRRINSQLLLVKNNSYSEVTLALNQNDTCMGLPAA
jgi:hypothetical protein